MNNSKKTTLAFSWLALSLAAAIAIPSAGGQTAAQSAAKPLDKNAVVQKALEDNYTLNVDRGLLLMTGFDDINSGSQKVSVQIQYQTIEGFQLPSKVSYVVTSSGQTVPMDMYFAKYQLGKR
jgi:type II secretory pathway pseudopilin PulG